MKSESAVSSLAPSGSGYRYLKAFGQIVVSVLAIMQLFQLKRDFFSDNSSLSFSNKLPEATNNADFRTGHRRRTLEQEPTAKVPPSRTSLSNTGGDFPSPSLSLSSAGSKRFAVMAPFMFPMLYQCVKPAMNGNITKEKTLSQSNEDVWLWEKIFSKLPLSEVLGGTFIEIGALNGLQYSNTFQFEKVLDFRGLLIEGHPVNSKKLFANRDIRNQSAIFSNAICKFTSHGDPGSLRFTKHGDAIGASVSQSNTAFLNTWHGPDSIQNGSTIACIPLQEILKMTGMLDVDLFSLDVEGAEMAVLETVDFHATNIRVIVVELDNHNKEKDSRVRSLLHSHGFVNSTSLGLGIIRDGCSQGGECLWSEVFINPHFLTRKTARLSRHRTNRYYKDYTGERCSTAVQSP